MISLLLLAALGFAAEPVAEEHRAPARSLADPAHPLEVERQAMLAEMRQRRVLPPEAVRWTNEDMQLLLAIRKAEKFGAITMVKRRLRGEDGLISSGKATGAVLPPLRLTKEGYARWQELRGRDSIEFFEAKGVDARWVFQLVDMQNRHLYDGAGRLTAAGEAVYNQARVNMPVWWKVPQTGQVFGTRPPPR